MNIFKIKTRQLIDFVKRKPKRSVVGFIFILLILKSLLGGNGVAYDTTVVEKKDLQKTSYATGNLVSEKDIGLAFEVSGTIKEFLVKEGDQVKAGDVIAYLDDQSFLAELAQAKSLLSSRSSSFSEAVSSSSLEIELKEEAVKSAERALDETKAKYETIVDNARATLFSDGLVALPKNQASFSGEAPVISGFYVGEQEGSYVVRVEPSNASSGASFRLSGLESGIEKEIVDDEAISLGTNGLLIEFADGFDKNMTWEISVPNKSSSSYVTNLSAFNEAVKARNEAVSAKESDLKEAQISLAISLSQNSSSALNEQGALADEARNLVLSRESDLEKTKLISPVDGVVTDLEGEIGEQVQAYSQIGRVETPGLLLVEALFSELDVIDLSVGKEARIFIDALDRDFSGEIMEIAPTAVINEGVVRYKALVRLTELAPELRPGMTARATVIVDELSGVFALPSRAIHQDDSGLFVYVLNGKKKTEKRYVTVGEKADGNLREISSGVEEGDVVIVDPTFKQ